MDHSKIKPKRAVKCKACADGPAPGVLNNGERCDTCERYNGDHAAVLELVRLARNVPELLAALQACLGPLQDEYNRAGHTGHGTAASWAFVNAKTAIAKATYVPIK